MPYVTPGDRHTHMYGVIWCQALSGCLGPCNRHAELSASPQLQHGAGSRCCHIWSWQPMTSQSDGELMALRLKYSRERLMVRSLESRQWPLWSTLGRERHPLLPAPAVPPHLLTAQGAGVSEQVRVGRWTVSWDFLRQAWEKGAFLIPQCTSLSRMRPPSKYLSHYTNDFHSARNSYALNMAQK